MDEESTSAADRPARASKRESKRTPWGVLAWLLALPVGLAIWRGVGLGAGATDLLPQFLLDLLVGVCLVTLLSGPLRDRPPLPAIYTGSLALLSLYVAWLYRWAGAGTWLLLLVVTLVVGILLRVLRERLSVATFVKSDWMTDLDLTSDDVPQDAVLTRDAITGGRAHTWQRFVATPVIAGLLLAFVAIRVGRPLDKRAEARTALAKGDPFEIGQAFLKAATNGNALLFVDERTLWYAERDRRGAVLEETRGLFEQAKREDRRLGLQWVDLGTLPAAEESGATAAAQADEKVETYGGRVIAYLEDPDSPPAGLDWIDEAQPYEGFFAWVEPLRVTFRKTPAGWRVTDAPDSIQVRLRTGK